MSSLVYSSIPYNVERVPPHHNSPATTNRTLLGTLPLLPEPKFRPKRLSRCPPLPQAVPFNHRPPPSSTKKPLHYELPHSPLSTRQLGVDNIASWTANHSLSIDQDAVAETDTAYESQLLHKKLEEPPMHEEGGGLRNLAARVCGCADGKRCFSSFVDGWREGLGWMLLIWRVWSVVAGRG